MAFEDILSKAIEVLFVTAGVVITIVAVCRNRCKQEDDPPVCLPEIIATVIAGMCIAVGPNILVVGLTPGMPEMPVLSRYALVPSILLLLFIFIVSWKKGFIRLTNRIWTGIWAGAVATGVLDVVRLTGFYLDLMPGNMPRMFGVLILDTMAEGPTPFSDFIGYFYHYWVGACFGLTLTLICGKVRWWAGLIWGLVIEIGMMITPPMVIAMDTGYFGLKFGAGLLIVSLIAHIVYGIVLGMLVERYVKHKDSIFHLIRSLIQNKLLEI